MRIHAQTAMIETGFVHLPNGDDSSARVVAVFLVHLTPFGPLGQFECAQPSAPTTCMTVCTAAATAWTVWATAWTAASISLIMSLRLA